MALIGEKEHQDILKKHNINIKTKYIVGNSILERNSDNSYCDDIANGIICEKDYFFNNKLLKKETIFDSRIEYTFVNKENNDKDFECVNCGNKSKMKDFIDGCPYCGTYYNIDYKDKDLGGKYHYDLVIRKKTYRIITLVVDIIISILLSFIFIKLTSRTFNNYDISKIFIYGIILAIVLYYFFYIIDGYIILEPIKKYKNKQNEKQKLFWDKTKIDKKKFYNNLNYELTTKYCFDKNIIDYDILDYLEFKEITKDKISVKLDIRLIYLKNGRIVSDYQEEVLYLNRNNQVLKINNGTNYHKCPNCGASIDITKGHCDYCEFKINSFNEWILDKEKETK